MPEHQFYAMWLFDAKHHVNNFNTCHNLTLVSEAGAHDQKEHTDFVDIACLEF